MKFGAFGYGTFKEELHSKYIKLIKKYPPPQKKKKKKNQQKTNNKNKNKNKQTKQNKAKQNTEVS